MAMVKGMSKGFCAVRLVAERSTLHLEFYVRTLSAVPYVTRDRAQATRLTEPQAEAKARCIDGKVFPVTTTDAEILTAFTVPEEGFPEDDELIAMLDAVPSARRVRKPEPRLI